MRPGLLIVGHGSRSAESDDVLPYYVDAMIDSGSFSEVRACYLEKPPSIQDSIAQMTAGRVFVMPLLITHGHHTRVTIPEALGVKPHGGTAGGRTIVILEPLGRSEHIVSLIKERTGRHI